MTNEPYRDEPPGPGGGPPPGGQEPSPESAWMPPGTPTPETPTSGTPTPETPALAEPYQSPTPPSPPATAYQSPQYQSAQYQSPQYQGAQYQVPPAGAQAPPPYPGGQRPTNSLAIIALVCAVAGVITLISAPVGAVLGHLATRQIAQTGEEGAGLAKAAIWVGWIITGLAVAACCAVLAVAIAIGRTGDFGPQ